MAPVTMTVTVTVTMAVMPVTRATLPMPLAAMLATGGRRSDRSRGQSESRDGSEGNLAKHLCSPFQA